MTPTIFALRRMNPDGSCECGAACDSPGKHPAEPWRNLPAGYRTSQDTGAWGLATGQRSGVWVLDLDRKAGKDGVEAFQALTCEHGGIPSTLTVQTPSGGYHLYWAQPDGISVPNSVSRIASGVDVRGDGGYVVIPPSPHKSGGVYRHLNAIQPVPAPQWLLDMACGGGPAGPSTAPPTIRIGPQALSDLATKLKRRKDPWSTIMAEAIKRMSQGEPFADAGDRDDALWRIALCCAEHMPWASAESLGALAIPSLQLMDQPNDPAPDLGNAVSKFARAKQYVIEQRAEKQEQTQAQFNVRRRSAWWMVGVNSDLAYTQQDIERLAEYEKCTVDELHRRWIIRYRNTIYPYVAGRYLGPFLDASDASCGVLECLALAEPWLELTKTLPDGHTDVRPLNALIRDYGTVAHNVSIDMTANRTHYNAVTRTLVEAPCPPRDIPAIEHPAVARWLEIFAGPKHELLLDWIAWLPRLDVPLCALFLYGAKDQGKSFLPSGLARLWGEFPTALESAMSAFNDACTRNPLWFADERLPQNWRGQIRTEDLRELVQSRSLVLNRKFLPAVRVVGSPRIVIAANSDGVFGTVNNLTQNDIDAFAERFLCINITNHAQQYLAATPHENWVSEDIIAQHARWLYETRRVKSAGRFQVRDSDDMLARVLSVRSGARFQVLAWCVRYTLTPDPANNVCRRSGLSIDGGKLYANARTICDNWGLYVKDPLPTAASISAALRGIARKRDRKLGSLVYEIDDTLLAAWAEDNGECTLHDLYAALQRDTVATERVLSLVR